MDFKTRLERIEESYVEYFDDSCFTNYTNEGLIKYIKNSIENCHKENNIKSCAEGVSYYNSLYERDLLTEDEKKLHQEMEMDFWKIKQGMCNGIQ